MTEAGGAAFNPNVLTQDGPVPESPDERPCADEQRDHNEADNGPVTGEDWRNGVR